MGFHDAGCPRVASDVIRNRNAIHQKFNDMEIKLNVEIDFSERVENFLTRLFGAERPAPALRDVDPAPAPAPVDSVDSEAPVAPSPAAEAGDMPFDKEIAPEAAKEAKPKPKPEPELKEGEVVRYSDEHLRTEMDYTFRQVVGEDWETAQGDKLVKKRRVTALFKQIAGELGAPESKPTRLPKEKRQEFIDRIKNIVTGEDGVPYVMPF